MRTTNSKLRFIAVALMSTLSAMMACHKDMLKPESSIAQLQKKAATFDSANEVSLLPVADAYVQDGTNASTNYGDNSWLIAKDDAPGYRRDIYLRFDLTALPSNVASVQSARVELAGGVSSAADTAMPSGCTTQRLKKIGVRKRSIGIMRQRQGQSLEKSMEN